MAKRLIDANATKKALLGWETDPTDEEIEYTIEQLPAVDAVEYDVLRKWLHEIAINNVKVPITMDVACEIIVARFEGLRMYARANGERRTDGNL